MLLITCATLVKSPGAPQRLTTIATTLMASGDTAQPTAMYTHHHVSPRQAPTVFSPLNLE